MPTIRPKPLSHVELRRFAGLLLGHDLLPDHLSAGLADLIERHRAARRDLVRGHTPASVAAALHRLENHLRRGRDDDKATRAITDPRFGVDTETSERLAPIIADAEVPIEAKLAATEARRREVEALDPVDPRYALRVLTMGCAAAWIWHVFAVRREDQARQWQFLLAVLEACCEGTEGLRQHPERIKRDVGRLLDLTAQP